MQGTDVSVEVRHLIHVELAVGRSSGNGARMGPDLIGRWMDPPASLAMFCTLNPTLFIFPYGLNIYRHTVS
jgi:hypothetical protein